MLTQQQFFEKMLPHARLACRMLEVPEASMLPVILAQWDVESGREMATWVGGHNYAGITNGGPPNFLRYSTVEEFVRDYVDVLLTTWGGSAYGRVLELARAGRPPVEVARALAASPWDAGHYGGDGSILLERLPFYVEALADREECPPWAVEARDALKAAGVTDGTRPNDPATRAEVWAMLHRMGVE